MYAAFVVGNTTKARVTREGGIAPGTPWSEVPEDFECPLCGVGKDSFEEA